MSGYLASIWLFAHAETPEAGPISGLGMATLIAAGVLAAPLGVRISHKLPVKRLRQVLVGALIGSAARLLRS